MRNIATFHRLATAAVEKTAAGNAEGQKITFNVIKQRLGDVMYKVTAQKFEDPGAGGRGLEFADLIGPGATTCMGGGGREPPVCLRTRLPASTRLLCLL